MTTLTEQESVLSIQQESVLRHRYYLRDDEGEITENAPSLFERVAKAVAATESQYYTLSVETALVEADFLEIMQSLEFLPNSPTLMNAGTGQGTYSACFVLPLEDSMEGIMKAATDSAMVQKFGGGTGFSLSNIRPRGSKIKTTHGIACGPIEVLKTLSRVSSMITQGGKRDGANMAVMSVYHPDIMDFIHCKSVEGDIHNFNISVGVDSNWMKCVENDMEYSLINPHTNTVDKTLRARDVFKQIVAGAWKNGEPGMIFLDRINEDNHVLDTHGPIIATNPCGEQPLLGNESCNLGSINLAKFFKKEEIQIEAGNGLLIRIPSWKKRIDWKRLEKVTRTATRFLDNIIDANEYSTPEIEEMTKATRKIGLGVMGFADLLIQLRVAYDSDLARDIADSIINNIKMWTNDESLNLGVIRGAFPSWEQSSYDKITEAYRNSCRLTVAPTGTISMIADCSSGIEPTFALVWNKQNILDGETFTYVNNYFKRDAKEYGFYSDELMTYLANGESLQERTDVPDWIKEVYITAPEISPKDHILMQSVFQEHVDSGISKTINFSNTASVEDVWDSYMLAWKTRCKGVTVYRNGSREKEVLVKGITSQCCSDPHLITQEGCQSCKNCGWSACLVA